MKQEAPVAGLLPRDDFDMQLSAFINVAKYGGNHDASWNIPATQKFVGPSAEIHAVIETRLFNFLDQVRAR